MVQLEELFEEFKVMCRRLGGKVKKWKSEENRISASCILPEPFEGVIEYMKREGIGYRHIIVRGKNYEKYTRIVFPEDVDSLTIAPKGFGRDVSDFAMYDEDESQDFTKLESNVKNIREIYINLSKGGEGLSVMIDLYPFLKEEEM